MATQTVRRSAPPPPQAALAPIATQSPPAAQPRTSANLVAPPSAGGNQAAYRTLAASQGKPVEAPAAPGSAPSAALGGGKPKVKLQPLSPERRAQMARDVDRIAKVMKSWFIESGDQITVIALIGKYADLDGNVRPEPGQSATPNLDHFLILLKSRAFSRSSVKSLFQDQWAILYDALWYRLRSHYLDQFRELVNRSHTQKTAGPGDKDVENGVALIAKQEAMGMWGMLKGMGTGLVGIGGATASQYIADAFDETGRILFDKEWDAAEPLVWGMNAGQIGTAGGDVIMQLVMLARAAGPGKADKIYVLIDKVKRAMGVGASLQGVYLGAEGLAQSIEARRSAGRPITAEALLQDPDFVGQLVVVATSAIGAAMAVKGAPASKADAVTRERIQMLMGQAHIAVSLARFSEIAASDKPDAEKEREYGQVAVSLIGQIVSSLIDARGVAKARKMPEMPSDQQVQKDAPPRQDEAPPAKQVETPAPRKNEAPVVAPAKVEPVAAPPAKKATAKPKAKAKAAPASEHEESGELSRKTMNDAAPPSSSKKPAKVYPESDAGQQLQAKLRTEAEAGAAPRKAPTTPDEVTSGAREPRYQAKEKASINVGKPVKTLEEARARYDDVIAETQGKYEVGVYQKPDGTFVVRLGEPDKVDAPSEWRTVQHYHTNEPDIPLWRMPARADLNEPYQRAERTGQPTTEFTEYPLPGGKRGKASYTVHPDGAVEIRFIDADGNTVVKPFPSVKDYNDYYKTQTVFVAPGSKEYKQLTAGFGKPKTEAEPGLSTKTMHGPGAADQPPATATKPAKTKPAARKTPTPKQSNQVLNEQERIKAAEAKTRLEADITRQEDLVRDTRTPAGDAQRLKELISNPKRMPAELANDVKRLPDDLDERVEALRELQKKNGLSAEAVEYLKWQTEVQDLRAGGGAREVAQSKHKDNKEGLEARVGDAAAALRRASKTIKQLMRRVGKNYRQASKITFDQVLKEARYNALPPEQRKKGLQTDHLVPLDWVANSPEMTAFLKAYAAASPEEQARMGQALVDIGDMPENLVRMRADANNFKSAKRWSEMSLEDLKRYGYDIEDHKKMIERETKMLQNIKEHILALAGGDLP